MRAVDHRECRLHREPPCRAAGRRRLAGDRRRRVHAATTTPPTRRPTSPAWPTSRASTWSAPTWPTTPSTAARATVRWSFHLAAQPGVRGSFGAGFAHYVHDNVLATQRVFEAALEAGCPRVVLRLVVVGVRRRGRLPVPRGRHPDRAALAVRRHEAGVRGPRRRLPPASASTSVGLRYFTVYGPRQRPDMAIRRLCEAATRRPAVPAVRRRHASRATSPTSTTPSTPPSGR